MVPCRCLRSCARFKVAPLNKNLIGHTLNFYDDNAFQGLPFGQIGKFGALVRTDNLVLTSDVLKNAYVANPPPYITSGGTPTWTADYPQEFQALLPPCAGYTYQSEGNRIFETASQKTISTRRDNSNGGTGSAYQTGYYRSTELRTYANAISSAKMI